MNDFLGGLLLLIIIFFVIPALVILVGFPLMLYYFEYLEWLGGLIG